MQALNTAITNELKLTMGPRYREPVKIAPSLLPGAGLGLFATRDLDEGEFLVYTGAIITQSASKVSDSAYLASFAPPSLCVVDAQDPHCCFARYSNDPIDEGLMNADLATRGAMNNAFLWMRINQHIPKGAEIYTGYGNVFWLEPNHFEALPFESQRLLYETNRGGSRAWIDENYHISNGRYVRGQAPPPPPPLINKKKRPLRPPV